MTKVDMPVQEAQSRPMNPADAWVRVEDGWTPGDVMAFLHRRWRWIVGLCVTCMLVVTLHWIAAPPQYTATGTIEVQKQPSHPLGPTGLDDDRRASSDALDYDVTLQTQVDILKSDTLALKVIQQLGIEKTQSFFGGKPYLFRRGFAFWRQPLEPLSVPLKNAPNRRYAALKIFHSKLRVMPVSGTRLIRISYKSRNPQQAAAVVNALIQSLMEYSFDARYAATAQAEKWLSGQMAGLKQQTASLEEKSIALQRATGMFGDNEQNNVTLTRLEALNQTLAADEADRILKGAIYQTAKSGNPELISDLGGNAARSTGVQNSLELIQNLRANEAAVSAKIAQDSRRYGARFPEMAELESERASLKKSIAKEIKRLGARAHTDYLIAARAEAGAQAAFEQQKQLVDQLNNKVVAYKLASQEADASRNLYENLLGKVKEAGVLAGLESTDIQVVNPARTPSVNHPDSPSFLKDEAMGIAGGLLLGFAVALVFEMTDERLHSQAEVEELAGCRLLASIPDVQVKSRMSVRRWVQAWNQWRGAAQAPHALIKPESRMPLHEPFRMLRTAMQVRYRKHPPQVILVTSPVGGEGKSTVASQLASAFAWQKSKVLLVEADFRSASSTGHAETDIHGLDGELHGKRGKAMRSDGRTPNLMILPRGSVPEFPAELLGSERMLELMEAWRSEYDYIVMDGPPYLSVADAAVLAQHADSVLLVLREGRTLRDDALHALDMLRRQIPENAGVGVVLNGSAKRKGRPVYAVAS